jgi:hypothetical protein
MIGGAKWQNFLNTLVCHWSLVIGQRQQRASLQRNDKWQMTNDK